MKSDWAIVMSAKTCLRLTVLFWNLQGFGELLVLHPDPERESWLTWLLSGLWRPVKWNEQMGRVGLDLYRLCSAAPCCVDYVVCPRTSCYWLVMMTDTTKGLAVLERHNMVSQLYQTSNSIRISILRGKTTFHCGVILNMALSKCVRFLFLRRNVRGLSV